MCLDGQGWETLSQNILEQNSINMNSHAALTGKTNQPTSLLTAIRKHDNIREIVSRVIRFGWLSLQTAIKHTIK